MEIKIEIIIRPSRYSSARDESDEDIKTELEQRLNDYFTEITGYNIDEIDIDINR